MAAADEVVRGGTHPTANGVVAVPRLVQYRRGSDSLPSHCLHCPLVPVFDEQSLNHYPDPVGPDVDPPPQFANGVIHYAPPSVALGLECESCDRTGRESAGALVVGKQMGRPSGATRGIGIVGRKGEGRRDRMGGR